MENFLYKGTNANPNLLFNKINRILEMNKKFQINNNSHYVKKSIIWLATYFSENPIVCFNKHLKNSLYKKDLQKMYF